VPGGWISLIGLPAAFAAGGRHPGPVPSQCFVCYWLWVESEATWSLAQEDQSAEAAVNLYKVDACSPPQTDSGGDNGGLPCCRTTVVSLQLGTLVRGS
jgi:hypothetical protein